MQHSFLIILEALEGFVTAIIYGRFGWENSV